MVGVPLKISSVKFWSFAFSPGAESADLGGGGVIQAGAGAEPTAPVMRAGHHGVKNGQNR